MNEPNKVRRAWLDAAKGNVLVIGLVSLFSDTSSEMMNPLLPIFIAGLVPLGLAPVFVGLTEGIAETTASLLKLISGRVSDKLGKRKPIVVLGYGLSTLARPLLSFAGIVGAAWAGWQVVGLKFLDRVGKGIRTSPRDALIGDSVSPDICGLAFSLNRAMDHSGAILGSLSAIAVLSVLLGHGIWQTSTGKPTAEEMQALRWVFAIAFIPGILAMATLMGRVREMTPGRIETAGQGNSWRVLPKQFLLFVAIVGLFTLGNSSDMFLLLYAWEKFHFGLFWVILLWIALHLSKVAFSVPGGMLSDLFGRRSTILAGWMVYALVYLGMGFANSEWQFWALFIAYGFYYGMSEGSEKALVADFVPSRHRGTAFGIYNGVIGLAALPGSILFGIFWSVIGPRWAFGIGAALAGSAAVLLLFLLGTLHPVRK